MNARLFLSIVVIVLLLGSASGADARSDVTCPGASVVLSGGNFSTGSGLGQNLHSSGPVGEHNWYTYFNNNDPSADTVYTYAVCAGR